MPAAAAARLKRYLHVGTLLTPLFTFESRPMRAACPLQSVLAKSPEPAAMLLEEDEEDDDFVLDLDEMLAAATEEEEAAAQQVGNDCCQAFVLPFWCT